MKGIRLLAGLGLAWCATAVIAQVAPPESQPAGSTALSREECLLEMLESAPDNTTVAELRAWCDMLQQSSAAPPEDGRAAPGASSPPAGETPASVPSAVESAVVDGFALPGPPDPQSGVLGKRRRQEKAVENLPFGISAHRPNYLLATYNSKANPETWREIYPDAQLDNQEVKFQISLKAPIWQDVPLLDADLYGAYTQISWWQLFNKDESAPFREINYEPELFLRWDTNFPVLWFTNREIDFGVLHQSNGRGDPLSRSWNRLFAGTSFDRDNFAFYLRGWWRLPEDESDDDNPDIEDYMGYGDLRVGYKWRRQVFAVTLRHNLQSDARGAVQLDWTFPLGRRFKGYVQYFDGHGESLVDYDQKSRRLGVGVLLTDAL